MKIHPTKVLHVFGRLGRGGAPMRTLDLLRHLDRQHYQLHFCTLSDVIGNFRHEIEAAGGRVVTAPYGLFRFARPFTRLLLHERFDVVHSHVYYQSGNILRLAARCGVPVRVAHFRSSHDGTYATPIRRLQQWLLRRWIKHYATDILAVSRQAMQSAWGDQWQCDPRCRVVYNGLDPHSFAAPSDRSRVLDEFALPDDAFLCIHVGRMSPAKNHGRLVEIFATVASQRADAYLLLVGWGEQTIEEATRRRVAELGLAGRVCFCGERSDVPRLLKAADVLVFPSRWEGLPGVVIEACAAGTPVVASDLPSIQEIAARLPGIETVSLDRSNQTWASRVSCPLRSRAARGNTQSLSGLLSDTEFAIRNCAETMCSVWDGQRRILPSGG